ncbi:MAG: YraN family protein [Terriglobales bacterium]|jgi:putative endonuclease
MFAGRLTQATLRVLDWLAYRMLAPEETPEHLRTGRRGEEDAYFYLRRRGYTIIARNFRSANHHGELDLVGWQRDVLCFIEVKTRTSRDFKPAEAAVDRAKQRDLSLVARDFLRQMPRSTPWVERGLRGARVSRDGMEWRFDVLAVYYDHGQCHPSFELFQNAFPVSYNRGFARY